MYNAVASQRPPIGEGVEFLFRPRGVAVVGASRRPGKVGYMVLYNLKNSYRGPIYPVNPNATEILGLKAYPSVLDVPDPVELAVIVVPAPRVPEVMDQVGRRGIKTAIIISAGFREVGEEGARLEEEVLRIARRYGVRILGPNCLGVYSPSTGINTMFLDPEKQSLPGNGPIAFISQSGALGAALLDVAALRGLGMSKFISIGNRADIDEADLLAYLKNDPHTKVIAIYVEGVEDGPIFRRALEDTTPVKPVVVLKAGKTSAGARAAASHTGSLAGSYQIYNAVFKQTGAIEVLHTEELFDVAQALALQPPMRGDRVAIITVGGGSGVMATDWLSELGFEVPMFSKETQEKLRKILLPIASPRNPVDITGSGTEDHMAESTRIAIESGEIDGIFLIPYFNIATMTERLADLMEPIAQKAKEMGIPIVASVTGGQKSWRIAKLFEAKTGIPVYPGEHRAARALWALRLYGKWLQRIGKL